MIESVITRYSGRVSVRKKGGGIVEFIESQAGLLEKGDEVMTADDGKVELQFLEGRGTLKVGPDSRVRMEEDDDGTQVMNLVRGKINVGVEKLESFRKVMNEKIKAYESDVTTVKDEVTQKIMDSYMATKKAWVKFKGKCQMRTRTPAACCCVRGTRFSIRVDENDNSELVVLEGSVELTGKDESRAIMVNEGYKTMVDKAGKVSEPEKIDLADPAWRWEE
jgi:ferric-dicitrate binding protein FerR (iron transport regulator)